MRGRWSAQSAEQVQAKQLFRGTAATQGLIAENDRLQLT